MGELAIMLQSLMNRFELAMRVLHDCRPLDRDSEARQALHGAQSLAFGIRKGEIGDGRRDMAGDQLRKHSLHSSPAKVSRFGGVASSRLQRAGHANFETTKIYPREAENPS
jgi:hypothetical protein